MSQIKTRKVLLISNNSGTAFWRVKNPLEFLRDIKACELQWMPIGMLPNRDRYWHEQWDVVVLHQSWDDQSAMFAQYMKSLGKKIVLSIDDLINGFKIPPFVSGGEQYRDSGVIHNIHDMMELADKIITTQPFLANELSHFFEIDVKKFYLLPNLPSFDWLGRYFNPNKKVANFKKRNKDIRIGVISSLSHYKKGEQADADYADDLEIVESAAKELKERGVNGIKFVMPIGTDNEITQRLKKYADVEGKPMVPIRQYPTFIDDLDLDLVVVPLQNNEFNNSKSNIKLIECAALGIPVIVSESYAYKGFIDDKFKFKDDKELVAKIMWIRGWSEKEFGQHIVENYNRFYADKPDYYGVKLQSYWMEQNIQLIGNTFLAFPDDFPDENEEQIVEPKLKQPEVK